MKSQLAALLRSTSAGTLQRDFEPLSLVALLPFLFLPRDLTLVVRRSFGLPQFRAIERDFELSLIRTFALLPALTVTLREPALVHFDHDCLTSSLSRTFDFFGPLRPVLSFRLTFAPLETADWVLVRNLDLTLTDPFLAEAWAASAVPTKAAAIMAVASIAISNAAAARSAGRRSDRSNAIVDDSIWYPLCLPDGQPRHLVPTATVVPSASGCQLSPSGPSGLTTRRLYYRHGCPTVLFRFRQRVALLSLKRSDLSFGVF